MHPKGKCELHFHSILRSVQEAAEGGRHCSHRDGVRAERHSETKIFTEIVAISFPTVMKTIILQIQGG